MTPKLTLSIKSLNIDEARDAVVDDCAGPDRSRAGKLVSVRCLNKFIKASAENDLYTQLPAPAGGKYRVVGLAKDGQFKLEPASQKR
jgi:hypothetical protein